MPPHINCSWFVGRSGEMVARPSFRPTSNPTTTTALLLTAPTTAAPTRRMETCVHCYALLAGVIMHDYIFQFNLRRTPGFPRRAVGDASRHRCSRIHDRLRGAYVHRRDVPEVAQQQPAAQRGVAQRGVANVRRCPAAGAEHAATTTSGVRRTIGGLTATTYRSHISILTDAARRRTDARDAGKKRDERATTRAVAATPAIF